MVCTELKKGSIISLYSFKWQSYTCSFFYWSLTIIQILSVGFALGHLLADRKEIRRAGQISGYQELSSYSRLSLAKQISYHCAAVLPSGSERIRPNQQNFAKTELRYVTSRRELTIVIRSPCWGSSSQISTYFRNPLRALFFATPRFPAYNQDPH